MTKQDPSWSDLLTLLELTPGAKGDKQAWFEKKFGVKVPRTSYDTMCARLKQQLGRPGTVRAVLDTVLFLAKPDLLNVLVAAANHDYHPLRVHEPAIVDRLFYVSGKPKRLGDVLLAHYRHYWADGHPPALAEHDGFASDTISHNGAEASPSSKGKAAAGVHPQIPTHVALSALAAMLEPPLLPCSPRNQGRVLVPFNIPKDKAFVAHPNTESELEQLLIDRWQKIDFGEPEQLLLSGRQVRVSDDKGEKVDLVARTASGKWYAIELKDDPATGNDLTQLLSYMRDIHYSLNISEESVYGLLIAPSFGEKVVNAAGMALRVRLLAYVTKDAG